MNNFHRPSRTLLAVGNLGKGEKNLLQTVPLRDGSPGSHRWSIRRDSRLSKSFRKLRKILTTWNAACSIKWRIMLWISWDEVTWQSCELRFQKSRMSGPTTTGPATKQSRVSGVAKPSLTYILAGSTIFCGRRLIKNSINLFAEWLIVAQQWVRRRRRLSTFMLKNNFRDTITQFPITCQPSLVLALPPAKVWLKRSTHLSKVLHSPRQ